MGRSRIALVLGGGAARALAHVGVLEVLEREGVTPAFAVGSSMGGLVAALWATGLGSAAIREIARGFRFPAWFVPGGVVAWDRVFRTAVPALARGTFADLPRRLAVVATDIDSGRRVVLRDGPVFPAVRATCAVPAVLPPVAIGGRWLVDGGLVSLLPVDVAAVAAPDVVVAVNIRAARERPVPVLRNALAAAGWAVGRLLPNPATARLSFELAVRATEIALDRQVALASAMVAPDVLVEVDVGTIGVRDFHRLDDATDAGRRAMQSSLGALREALSRPVAARTSRVPSLAVDPVCDMVVDAGRAPEIVGPDGRRYHFCSSGCRETFLRARAGEREIAEV
jgi:NTE family protein